MKTSTEQKTRRSSELPPPWARRIFDFEEHAEFARLVMEELHRQGFDAAELRGGYAFLGIQVGPREGRACLTNLAQMCKARPRPEWPEVIYDFFDSVLRTQRDPNLVFAAMESFDDVKEKIKVRLYPEGYLHHQNAGTLVMKAIAPGIAAMLVCDLGFANVSVPVKNVADWGMSVEELFTLGVKNVRAEGKLMESKAPPGMGLDVDLLGSPSNYAATHALFFEDYLGDAPYGAIVGVPQRHLLVRHVIRDGGVLEAMGLAQSLAADACSRGPGPITPSLYWWHKGKLEQLTFQLTPSIVQVAPSERFMDEVLGPLMDREMS